MPKIINYPSGCSFKESLEIARLVNKVGGKSNIGFIADNLGVKENTGGFRSKISGAIKYGMIEKKRDAIFLTDIGEKYFHPIRESDKEDALKESILSVPIFKEIIHNCQGQEIDKKLIESMLVRLFDVNNKIAGKVAWYFFKANEEFPFLEKLKNNKFKIVLKEDEEIDLKENIGESVHSLPQKIDSTKIDIDMFNLIISIGKKDLPVIKEILEKKKEFLTHAELISDLLDESNPKIIDKLILALKKDLKIEEENRNEN